MAQDPFQPDDAVEETTQQGEPLDIDALISDLEGFGVEEHEEPLTLKVGGKTVRLRISNLPVEDEIRAAALSEGYTGPSFIHFLKCQLLARSITWINGQKITPTTYVTHPKTGDTVPASVALADIIQTWGTVLVGVLWKILMVHTQRIEDRLIESFPESTIMTEVEKRFFDRAMAEMEEMNREIVRETMDAIDGVSDEG